MWKMPIAREIPNKVIDTARVYFLVIVFPFLIGLSWCDIANYLFFLQHAAKGNYRNDNER